LSKRISPARTTSGRLSDQSTTRLARLMDLIAVERWRAEAERAGHKINRISVAFEAGRDGFWLARWLRARGIEAHVIHAASVAVSREHRRAKSDQLDTEGLKRAFLGWLRGEREHCKMAAIPTSAEEDAKRPCRERETLVGEQTSIINRIKATLDIAGHGAPVAHVA
jgi:transposase